MTAGKVKRSDFRTYIDIDPGYEDWALIGEGARESTINLNPNVSEEQYIHEDSANKEVESYAPSQSVDLVAINGDEVFEFIEGLMWGQSILDDAHTQVVQVKMYEDVVGSAYPAYLWDVSIAVESFGGEGGQNVGIPFTIHFRGEPTVGTFDPSALTFTAS